MSSSPQKRSHGRKSPNQQQKPSPQIHTPDQKSNNPLNQSNAPKEPGMFQRVAETAAGVAVGSAIGNLVTNAVSGLFGSSSDPRSPQDPTPNMPAEEKKVCEREKLNFVHCTENSDSVNLANCEELHKEYEECRVKYNLK